MKISNEKFLDLFYSILLDDEIDSISVVDLIEVVKILFSSEEFDILASRLNVNDFTEENIINHKYTTEIDENGVISFDAPKNDVKNILKDNKVDAGYLLQAINKRSYVKMVDSMFQGKIKFKYDNPNGFYSLNTVESYESKGDTRLFTDGDLENSTYYSSDVNNVSTRTVKVNKASYSLVLNYIDDEFDYGEVRGTYYADYAFLLNQIQVLLNRHIESYDEVIDDKPKVYKFKRH